MRGQKPVFLGIRARRSAPRSDDISCFRPPAFNPFRFPVVSVDSLSQGLADRRGRRNQRAVNPAAAASRASRRAASAMSSVEPAKERRTQPSPWIGSKSRPGSRRDPGLGEHAAAEFAAVAGQRRDIDIEIERALGRRETGEPGLAAASRSAGRGWRGSGRHGRRARRGSRTPATAASCDRAGGEM